MGANQLDVRTAKVKTLVRAGMVVDGRSRRPLLDQWILIDGDYIEEIRPAKGRLPAADRIVDAHDGAVLPGLIDAHVHLCIPLHPDDPGGTDSTVTAVSAGLAAAYGVMNCRALVLAGVTSVRDVGAHGHSIFAVKQLVDRGEVVGPRIVACGQAIAMTGGHSLIAGTSADGTDEVRRMARQELAAGAGCLKVMASGSGASASESPMDVQYSQEEIAAAVREAKSRGRSVAVHSTNPTSTRNAVLAGADSIEHGIAIDEETLHLMKDRNVTYVPTVWAYHFVGELGGYLATSDKVRDEVKSRYALHHEVVRRAHDLGVAIAAGTDSALPLNPPHSLAWELEWLVHCGLDPLQTIAAGTLNAAELLGIANETGSIEPGKAADLIAVSGDPTKDVTCIREPTHVVQRGVLHLEHGVPTTEAALITDIRPMPAGPFPVGKG
jgi:imidazolonepropionase-like amidohydrolase